jgi:hypothetical protein
VRGPVIGRGTPSLYSPAMPHRPAVYLHIGAPKTGTTFLQGVLWANRATLAGRGVWLPGEQPNDHFRAGFDLRSLEQDPGDPREDWVGAWDDMAALARQSDADSVVVSDERLAACSAEEVERAVASLAPREVHVIYTLRDFVGLLPAEWQEHVKARDRRTFEEWLTDVTASRDGWFWQVHDGAEVLRRWGAAVPAERLHVLTLPRRGAHPDLLWERFASVLGIDPSGMDTKVAANATLGADGAELLRRVNESLPAEFPVWHQVELTREVLAHRVLATRQGKVPIKLPAAWADWVSEQTKHLIADLENSGYPIVGELSELMPDDRGLAQDGTNRPPDTTTAAADAIAGLLTRMGTMRDERRRVAAELTHARAERDAAYADGMATEFRRARDKSSSGEILRGTVVALSEHWRPVAAALRLWRGVKMPVASRVPRRSRALRASRQRADSGRRA